jgi:hypothetical protein
MEPALGGLNLADVDMEIANRVSFSAGRSVISELEAECDEMVFLATQSLSMPSALIAPTSARPAIRK